MIRRRQSPVAHDASRLHPDNRISIHRKTLMGDRASSHGNSRQRRLLRYCGQNVRFARFALADLRQIAFGHLACQCVVAIRQAIRPPPIDCEPAATSARNSTRRMSRLMRMRGRNGSFITIQYRTVRDNANLLAISNRQQYPRYDP